MGVNLNSWLGERIIMAVIGSLDDKPDNAIAVNKRPMRNSRTGDPIVHDPGNVFGFIYGHWAITWCKLDTLWAR